ncbi:MAG: peptide-methionine (S)-S-oxide reductase MsrA [Ruminococcaceae bacterium]|nr:peptide-methionine (S)-S-oxide reductase MsrA [Oscillospiraceae bacterium]
MKRAYFAGGCFWCITPTFAELAGVEEVVSGYSGGDEANPVYADVKAQRTGHRETIAVSYDPAAVSYEELLEIFLGGVDPFDDGGQYIDRGHSYTLAIYYEEDAERLAAEAALSALAAESGETPAVAVEPFRGFYPAEEEHQDYYRKHPEEFRQELLDSGRLKEQDA